MDKHGTDAHGVNDSMAETPAAPVTISPLAGKPAPGEILVDPTRLEREYFMTVDHDGKIRTDPSSPYAMARLVELGFGSPSPTTATQTDMAS
jgi:hypothetical protein